MHLTDIKNDLVTINYSPNIERLMLSDFILIEDNNQSILAQVISIEATMDENVNSAMLKFLLSIDKDANLTQYTGYVPSKGASLILVNPQEVVQLIKSNEKNVYMGNLVTYSDVPVELNIDFLRKRLYIQVDYIENKVYMVENIINGLEKHNKKTLLFDSFGLYKGISLPTVTLGYNFKLPLNYDALCYIAEEELNDCDNDNKAIIQGILIEVQNYVKSLDDDFLPFNDFISVLDSQYEENKLPELLLLKNKLLKYQQQGLFAEEKSEFDFLDTFLKNEKNFKFDLSELPIAWHKIAFTTILNLIKSKCYMIVDFSDENSNKAIIKKLYEKTHIKPIITSSYNYKYQLQLKALAKNLILFRPTTKINDFAGYTSFLNILSQDNFIVWGEQTLFIPMILKLQSLDINAFLSTKKLEIDDIKENNEKEIEPNKIDNVVAENLEENDYEPEDIEKNLEILEQQENQINEPEQKTDNDIENTQTNDIQDFGEIDLINEDIEEQPIENIIYENDSMTIESVEPEDVNDTPEDGDLDFFFDEQEVEQSSQENNEIIENIEDINIDENLNIKQNVKQQEQTVENKTVTVMPDEFKEEISPNDTKQESQIQEEQDTTSTAVPVYKSNVAPQINTKFAQGTFVYHEKYGRGVVERIINYGSKNLCWIIFDNEGRKLLDPNLAELKQV